MNKINLSVAGIVVAIIVAWSGYLMLDASRSDALIMDELAHIPAGYTYVTEFDYRLNPEHPPLVKALSGLPLRWLDLNFDTEKQSWAEDVNGQWWAGTQFIFEENPEQSDAIIFYSRLGPIFLTLLLIVLTYLWSVQLLGRWWAILPTFMLALSPTVLSHGHYVTTDIGATLGILIGIWTFVNFLEKPNRKTLVWAGLAFGIAQLLKFSAVLLIPFMIVMALIHLGRNLLHSLKNNSWGAKIKYLVKGIFRYAGMTLSVFIIGTILISAVYAIFVFNYPTERQTSDIEYTLTSFANGPTPEGQICQPKRCLAELDIWMAKHKITQPLGQYLYGVLMVMQRSSGGNTAYFLGEVGGGGWAYYFPVVYLLKEPIPILLLVLTGFLLALVRIKRVWLKRGIRIKEYLQTNWAEFSMLMFIIFYWAYSIRSPLNIGVRHILPTIPFIYILTASSLKKWVSLTLKEQKSINWLNYANDTLKFIFKSSTKIIAVGICMLWLFVEVLVVSPYYLSYFNQLGGGVMGGHRMVTDSNYDWGQDLKRLETFVDNNNIDKIAVDYFGGDSPIYRLGDKFIPWWSAKNNPNEEKVEWLAVSVNTLAGATAPTAEGFDRKPEDAYLWLKAARNLPIYFTEPPEPDFRVGTSLFVYHLPIK